MTNVLSRPRSRPLQVRLANQFGGMMSRLLGLFAEGRFDRLLPRELRVMPEQTDEQEHDQDDDGDRDPASQPIRSKRARHINATRIVGVSYQASSTVQS